MHLVEGKYLMMRLNWNIGESIFYERAEGELDIDNEIETIIYKSQARVR